MESVKISRASENTQRYLRAYDDAVHRNAAERVRIESARHAKMWAQSVFETLVRVYGDDGLEQRSAQAIASDGFVSSGSSLRGPWERERWTADFESELKLLVERKIGGLKKCGACDGFEKLGPSNLCASCARDLKAVL